MFFCRLEGHLMPQLIATTQLTVQPDDPEAD
jgi:hypothetical protein